MKAKYDEIGVGYNLTRKADPYLVERLCQHLQPTENGAYLDLGCGTGNYTIALNQLGLDFVGVDPSQEMLDKAKSKSQSIDWKQGSAEAIPLDNGEVNGATCCLTVHHWHNKEKAFKELYRVLKPGGTLVIFTSDPLQMKGYWLNHYFPKMMQDSIAQMPSKELVVSWMEAAGFTVKTIENYDVRVDLQDMFLYAGKHQPELYLDPQVRSGISSFSSLAYGEEVQVGLTKLTQDIATGKVKGVIKDYENEIGDYLYIDGYKPNR